MADLILELGTPAQTPGAQQPTIDRLEGLRAARPAAPSPARPPAAKAPAANPTPEGKGPWNNWGQPILRQQVTGKPADFDHTKPASKDAPHGYLKSGDPWSPYGCTSERGMIRTKPRPAMAGRDPAEKVQAQTTADRRLAPAELKAPANVAGLYAAGNDALKRLNDIVAEIQQKHPDTKWRKVPHPQDMGTGGMIRTDPHFGPGTIGDILSGTTGILARKLGDPEAKPAPKTIQEASDKIADASRYYGLNTDPKTTATVVAVIALIMVFMPAILAGLGKLVDKVRGGDRDGE